MPKRNLTLSVHQLVDFLLRSGDIDDRVYNYETMAMGSLLHSSFQSAQGKDYLSEVALEETIERPEGTIHLSGRADGIIVGGPYPIIDEIKSTVAPLEEFYEQQKEWHFAQALCYAYMYLHENGGEKASVQITYISQSTNDKMVKSIHYSLKEIEEKVERICDDYLDFHSILYTHWKKRDASIKTLDFPYKDFRQGQRDLAKYCYGLARKGGLLFAEAPTGIGKTMSTLYPFVKSMKEGKADKLFYLTAKTTGGMSAYSALGDLYEQGLEGYDSFLQAKEKLCFCPGHGCNPDDCPYAKNYYGKVKGAILEALRSGRRFDPLYIQELSSQKEICPFEFQLDLSLFSDFIICDYNYFFDPIVFLERYFGQDGDPSKYLVLIDEAHNLVERGRSMYSVRISMDEIDAAKKALDPHAHKAIKRALTRLKKVIREERNEGDDATVFLTVPETIQKALQSWKNASSKKKDEPSPRPGEDYIHLSRDLNKLMRLIDEYFGSAFRLVLEHDGGEEALMLLCLDPSPFLKADLERVKAAALFSATLSPIGYYMDAIAGGNDYPFLLLGSPFPKENLDLMIAPKVSVRYKDRARSYDEVAAYLQAFVEGKKGNYFLYFPSYEYLENIKERLHFEDADVFEQTKSMTPQERTAFLELFQPNPQKTTVGLLILGGAFSEGVDLVSDRLIGVALVGIGLPQINWENDLIREYRDGVSGNGFDYAYKDPDMNKVMQAVGRLIRSDTDRGAALLIDDRYLHNEYRRLFERTWQQYDVVLSPEEVKANLASFYKD